MTRLSLLTLACVLTSCVLTSCALDLGENGGAPCGATSDCPLDSTCYRGFCILGGGGACAEEGMDIDCYSGPEETVGLGACRPGRRTCQAGVLSSCRGEIVPGIEVCNGDDDDCDGRIDEVARDAQCDTGRLGACAGGSTVCVGPSATCVPFSESHEETCDATDEDCDGTVDESTTRTCYPDGAPGCVVVDGEHVCTGACVAGSSACIGGALTPCVGAVTPALRDGCTPTGSAARDDDCDGSTDEDCACVIGATQPCYDGAEGTAGVGACAVGMQTCERDGADARFGACIGMRTPVPERCSNAGRDDDCNGRVDDITVAGQACVITTQPGICRDGVRGCVGDVLTCVTTLPQGETCDGLDDDCDGRTDEGFDLLADPRNCGACGLTCSAGLSCCGGACVDLASSAAHCGACTTACGIGLGCCDATCTDLTASPTSCGACGHTCGAAEGCRDGLCCPAGTSVCESGCVDLRTTESDCGRCGFTCNGNETCTARCCCRADGRCRCA